MEGAVFFVHFQQTCAKRRFKRNSRQSSKYRQQVQPEWRSMFLFTQLKSSLQYAKWNHVTQISALAEMHLCNFLYIPSQVHKLLKGCPVLEITKLLAPPENLSDVSDGASCQELVPSPASCGRCISFTLNADGTPLIKSSATAIWPIQLLLTQFLREQWMNKLVLAALWFRTDCPVPECFSAQSAQFQLFQDALVEAMTGPGNDHFFLEFKRGRKTPKAFSLCCSVYSVAGTPRQGVTQFNGY